MHSHWSLVAFTLLVQTAVGSIWQTLMTLLFIQEPFAPVYFQVHVCFVLVLLGIGLTSAMGHLGKPLNSINSARNVLLSWLSKEIICVNLFAGVLAAIAAVAFFSEGVSQLGLMMGGSLAGVFAMYAMTRIYLIKTVPSWNHMGTPLTFIGSACLLGGLPAIVLLQVPGAPVLLAQGAASGEVVIGFSLLGILLKILAAQFIPFGKLTGRQRMLPVLQMIGVGILVVVLRIESSRSGASYLVALPVILISVGEYHNRKRFYDGYRRVGL